MTMSTTFKRVRDKSDQMTFDEDNWEFGFSSDDDDLTSAMCKFAGSNMAALLKEITEQSWATPAIINEKPVIDIAIGDTPYCSCYVPIKAIIQYGIELYQGGPGGEFDDEFVNWLQSVKELCNDALELHNSAKP